MIRHHTLWSDLFTEALRSPQSLSLRRSQIKAECLHDSGECYSAVLQSRGPLSRQENFFEGKRIICWNHIQIGGCSSETKRQHNTPSSKTQQCDKAAVPSFKLEKVLQQQAAGREPWPQPEALLVQRFQGGGDLATCVTYYRHCTPSII